MGPRLHRDQLHPRRRTCRSGRRAPRTIQGRARRTCCAAHAVREILRTLGYVDQSRVAAHGHSMGAFVPPPWSPPIRTISASPRTRQEVCGRRTSSAPRRARRRPVPSAHHINCTTAIRMSWFDHPGSAPRRDPASQPRSARVPRLYWRRPRRRGAESDSSGSRPKLVRGTPGAVASQKELRLGDQASGLAQPRFLIPDS